MMTQRQVRPLTKFDTRMAHVRHTNGGQVAMWQGRCLSAKQYGADMIKAPVVGAGGDRTP